MKKNSKKQQLNNIIGQKLVEAYGLADHQLIAEFDRVAAETYDQDNPEPEPSANTFDQILVRLNGEEKKQKKVIRIKGFLKAGLLVAVIYAMWTSSLITVSGERVFEYWVREESPNRSVWNNVEDTIPRDTEDEAYQKIHEEFGINVLRLMYRPKGMEFSQVKIYKDYAAMQYIYDKKNIYLYQTQQDMETSIGTGSDRAKVDKVFNRHLGQELVIKENVAENGKTEFSVDFSYEKAHYQLMGIMKIEEFKRMASKMSFEE